MNDITKWIKDHTQNPADCFCDVIMVSDIEQAIWDAVLIPNGAYEQTDTQKEFIKLLATVKQYLNNQDSKACRSVLESAVAYYEARGDI